MSGADGIAAIADAQFPDLARICLNAARWHPLPQVALDAVVRHAEFRARGGGWGEDIGSLAQDGARQAFARLIGAAADDIALVPSTTVAEQLVVRALDLPRAGAIVTDLMHFDASIYAYDAMAAVGADVRIVAPRDGGIDLTDVEAPLARGGVALVGVSVVSNMTGFAHDLPALVALAHAHGALVYADIIQVAGAVPFDVAASGVDFCATSGFKWLMGEMGLGFLYVRPDVRARLRRPVHGYRQLACDIDPWPPVGPRHWTPIDSAAGLFEAASLPVGVAVSLEASIGLIEDIGVARIAAHRAPLLRALDDALPRLGYPRITPAGSFAPFLVFDASARPDTAARLRAANIDAGAMGDVLRVSVSIFNTAADIDRLAAALTP